mmetsp:Transcript_54448/g.82489  ORF Transcript_54448/g.82489 Transcript_54448/m.82489 type:complete len:82 (-) Transcript_54448:210-455(-)
MKAFDGRSGGALQYKYTTEDQTALYDMERMMQRGMSDAGRNTVTTYQAPPLRSREVFNQLILQPLTVCNALLVTSDQSAQT